MRPRTALMALTAAAVALSLTACSAEEEKSTMLTVYAAASLKATFEELAEDFEEGHDGVEVELVFAGSSDLVAQIEQGAPADVLATADEATMAKAQAADLVDGTPEIFATNTLQLAVPVDNPAEITGLADLDDAKAVNLVVCAPVVPCGAATVKLAAAAGVTLRPVSEEQSVTDVLAKVSTGEADAGLVYVTDVTAADGAVSGIVVPEAAEIVNKYPAAVVSESKHTDLAAQFLELLTAEEGSAVLTEAGFGTP